MKSKIKVNKLKYYPDSFSRAASSQLKPQKGTAETNTRQNRQNRDHQRGPHMGHEHHLLAETKHWYMV